MILNKEKKTALIHVAKKQTGITDENYVNLLWGAAGIDSIKYLETEDQFKDIMAAFEHLGFKSLKQQGKTTSRPQWKDTWGGTPAQRAKIEVLWRTCARDTRDKSLYRFIKRIARVDHPRFLTVGLARKVIIALGKMMIKAGYNPETGGKKDEV